jgi:hypothetical protein
MIQLFQHPASSGACPKIGVGWPKLLSSWQTGKYSHDCRKYSISLRFVPADAPDAGLTVSKRWLHLPEHGHRQSRLITITGRISPPSPEVSNFGRRRAAREFSDRIGRLRNLPWRLLLTHTSCQVRPDRAEHVDQEDRTERIGQRMASERECGWVHRLQAQGRRWTKTVTKGGKQMPFAFVGTLKQFGRDVLSCFATVSRRFRLRT